MNGAQTTNQKTGRRWRLPLFQSVLPLDRAGLVGVEDGIMLALVLSLLQHVRHSYRPHSAVETRTPDGHWQMSALEPGRMAAPGLVVYWFGSDLFYANIDRFATLAHELVTESPSPVCLLVVDAGAITSVDYTAGSALKELVKVLAQNKVTLVFAHISGSLKADFDRQGLTELIGPKRLFETLRECLAAYETSVDGSLKQSP